MKTSPTLRIAVSAIVLSGLAASGQAQTLLSLGFESDTVGATAAGITQVTPATPISPATPYGALAIATGHVGSLVISSTDNPIGTGQALRVFDYSGGSSPTPNQNVMLTSPLTSSFGQVSIAFTYRGGPSLLPSDGNTFLRFTFGGSGLNAASSSASSTGNFARIAFSSINSTSGFTVGNIIADVLQVNPVEAANNLVQLFVNRAATTLDYSAPGGGTSTIAANSYHAWLNGTQLTSGSAIAGGNFSMHASSTPISHISFGSGGGQAGGDWVIDGLTVAAIPEPSTYAALVGIAALGLAFWRRSRR
jgi:hypothetical protein